MKEVVLSHGSEAMLYLVPDPVAEQLDEYCSAFACHWLWESPHAERYRKMVNGIRCIVYGVPDFIEYLNTWVYPNQPSSLVGMLGCDCHELPEQYKDYPQFNF